MARNKQAKAQGIVIAIGSIVAIVVLITGFMSPADARDNKIKGKVKVSGYLYKQCDGYNLIYTYNGKAVTVSPDDPQCY